MSRSSQGGWMGRIKMDDLKPCPFCGGRGYFPLAADGQAQAVYCAGNDGKCCGINGPVHRSKQAAIDAWNTRAGEE